MPSSYPCRAIVKRTGKPCLRETKDGLAFCGYHKKHATPQPSAVPPSQPQPQPQPPPPSRLDSPECSICMDKITQNKIWVTTTPCKHVFHKKCLDQWKERFHTAPTCPNCRAVIGSYNTYQERERWLQQERRRIDEDIRCLCARMRVLYVELEETYPNMDATTRRLAHQELRALYDRRYGALQDALSALQRAEQGRVQ